MELFSDLKAATLVSTIVYTVLGMGMFGVALMVMNVLAPFSLRKEIEEDQNVALAIIIGATFIGLSIIVGAVMLS